DQRAQPHRLDADFALEERHERRGVLERNVDVLDHRLSVDTPQPVEARGESMAAGPSHDALIGPRAETAAPVEPAQQWILRTDVFRAPEPVGVPAPDEIGG